jgi:hypothetical protein
MSGNQTNRTWQDDLVARHPAVSRRRAIRASATARAMSFRRRSAALRPLLPQGRSHRSVLTGSNRNFARCDCAGTVAIISPRRDVPPSRKPSNSLRPPSPCTCETRGAEGRLYDKAAGCRLRTTDTQKATTRSPYIGDTLWTDFDLDAWIHGHAHETYDRKVSGTRVITNAKGSGPWPPNPGSSSRSN